MKTRAEVLGTDDKAEHGRWYVASDAEEPVVGRVIIDRA
jgi:hypothetical protein